jgi:hypothetical protein
MVAPLPGSGWTVTGAARLPAGAGAGEGFLDGAAFPLTPLLPLPASPGAFGAALGLPTVLVGTWAGAWVVVTEGSGSRTLPALPRV